MRDALNRLGNEFPTIRDPAHVLRRLEAFQMTHWGASSSGNLQEYRTPDSAAARAAQIKQSGATTVITNGLQNRFNYPHLADDIAERQRVVAEACHQEDLQVIDHLDLTIFWQSSYTTLFDHSDWAMRNLRDGTPIRWLCMNHPEYREFYVQYLQKLMRAGIDGFMLDEISFHDQQRAYCGCVHCRTGFERDTGVRFPEYRDDDVINNLDHPMWRLWWSWQRRSIAQFKAMLLERLRAINPDVIILAYSTAIYRPNVRAVDMLEQAGVCFIGTEGTNTVYPGYANFYSQHRILSAFARRGGRPSWALYSANNAPENRFAAFHSALTNSGLWLSGDAVAQVYRWPHWREARAWGQPVGDIAVVLVTSSRDGNVANAAAHCAETIGWCQAFGVGGVQFDIVTGRHTSADDLTRFKAVVVPHAPSMPFALAEAIDHYVRGGGVAVVTGNVGHQDPLGQPANGHSIIRRMGIDQIETIGAIAYRREAFEGVEACKLSVADGALPAAPRRITVPGTYRFDAHLNAQTPHGVLAQFENGEPAMLSIPHDRGRYVYLACLAGLAVHQPRMHKSTVWGHYLDVDTVALIKAVARHATGDRDRVVVEGDGVLSATYQSGNRVWVRMVNVSGVELQEGERVGTLTPSFPPVGPIRIRMRMSVGDRATLFSPDLDEPMLLELVQEDREAAPESARTVTIPHGAFTQFAFVRFELQ